MAFVFSFQEFFDPDSVDSGVPLHAECKVARSTYFSCLLVHNFLSDEGKSESRTGFLSQHEQLDSTALAGVQPR